MSLPEAAYANPPRTVELFGTAGYLAAAGDDGSEGSGAMFGGAATLPFASRWAIDIQILSAKLSDAPDFRLSRLLVSPAVQYRRGNAKNYWFIAFGPGAENDNIRFSAQIFDGPGPPRSFEVNRNERGLTLHWRSGAVFEPTNRLLIRTELIWVHRYVLPNLGMAISLGVRLGNRRQLPRPLRLTYFLSGSGTLIA